MKKELRNLIISFLMLSFLVIFEMIFMPNFSLELAIISCMAVVVPVALAIIADRNSVCSRIEREHSKNNK